MVEASLTVPLTEKEVFWDREGAKTKVKQVANKKCTSMFKTRMS